MSFVSPGRLPPKWRLTDEKSDDETIIWNESASLPYHFLEGVMNTEKKPNEQAAKEPKKDVGEIIGDLVVSGGAFRSRSGG